VKKLLLTVAVLAGFATAPAWAVDVTGNIGWNSEYIFRGVPQADSSPFGGVDVTEGGFYGGIWAADVEQAGPKGTTEIGGLEIDYYGGYTGTFDEFDYGIGATWYTYTDDFDDEYLELNLNGGWRFLTLDIAIGRYKDPNGPTQDYQFYALTGDYKNFYAKIGIFADDFDGEYFEAGYGDTLSVQDVDLVDWNFSVIYSSDDLLGGDDDLSLVLSISKTFDLFRN